MCDDRNGQAVVVFHLSPLLLNLSVSFTALQCASLSSVGDFSALQQDFPFYSPDERKGASRLIALVELVGCVDVKLNNSGLGAAEERISPTLCLAASTPKSLSSHSEILGVVLVRVANSFWVAWAEFPLAELLSSFTVSTLHSPETLSSS